MDQSRSATGTPIGSVAAAVTAVIALVTGLVVAVGVKAPPAAAAQPSHAGDFVSVSPQRLLDTRSGIGAAKGAVSPWADVTVAVAGIAGVPADAAAVALNLTVTEPTAPGWLSATADGTSLPLVSNLNFDAGDTVANMAIVQVGPDGKVRLHNGSIGRTHVLADVMGYYVGGAPSDPGTYAAVSPQRLLDTRAGTGGPTGPVGSASGVSLAVTNVAGVPSNASAVVLNVTVTEPATSGWVAAFGDGSALPPVSNLNFSAGQTIAKLVMAPVGSNGRVRLYNGPGGGIQLIADIAGYYVGGTPTQAGAYSPLSPQRLVDTRSGLGGVGGKVAPWSGFSFTVAGLAGVPRTATAVVLNVTATEPTAPGWASGFADGATVPSVSNLNFTAGDTVPNMVIAQIGSDGKVRVYNGSAGAAHYVVDISGYVLGDAVQAMPTGSPQAMRTMTPTRLVDTRSNTGAPGPVLAGADVSVQVAGTNGIPSNASAAVLNVTVTQPARSGYITAYADGATLPSISNVTFAAGSTLSTLVIAQVGSNGKVRLHNGSDGAVQLVVDVSDYFVPSSSYAGAFESVTPSRLLDTRSGVGGNAGTVAPWSAISFPVAGVGGIPTNAAAVVMTVTAIHAQTAGWAAAFADGAATPSISTLNFGGGQSVSNAVIAQIGGNGQVRIYNGSPGATDYTADVTGFIMPGTATTPGSYVSVAPTRLYDSRNFIGGVPARIASYEGASVQVAGLAGVPAKAAAAVLNVTAVGPSSSGWLSAYANGTTRPNVSNLNFAAGQTLPNLVVARIGQDGKVKVYNGGSRTTDVVVDVVGYVIGDPATGSSYDDDPPLISTSRYPRDLHGGSADGPLMYGRGQADAQANPAGNPYLILLDIGGQSFADDGVVLTATSLYLTYGQLVAAIDKYVDGYAAAQADDTPTTIVLGTNNDMLVNYSTGQSWARNVVNPVATYAAKYPNIVIGGADDMEPGFSADVTSTRNWLSGFLSATGAPFVFNGSADGCPQTYAGGACNHGWTESDLYWLSGGAAPTRILSLPQIYFTSMSRQWKYISLTGVNSGKPRIAFIGPLTEYTACEQGGWDCGSFGGNDAWWTFWGDLSSDGRVSQAVLPVSTDLRIN